MAALHFLTVNEVGQVLEKRRHRDDIHPVVLENVPQQSSVASPEPVEVALGNFEAGNVSIALDAEDMCLYGCQACVFQAMGEYPPARVEQIHVRHGRQRLPASIEDEPGCKKVQVKGFAVEGHQEPFVRRKLAEMPQHCAFFGEVPRKELAGDE